MADEVRKIDRAGEIRYIMYFVYILLCSDNKPYTGCTNNLAERIKRHQKGNVSATSKRLPVKLVSYFVFTNKYKAFEFEKYLKNRVWASFLKKKADLSLSRNR
jgi:predicted GIY-YIG superfamily endonuclease